MEFRIADIFTESLARLTGDEQKAVKTTAFDLQLNPANPMYQRLLRDWPDKLSFLIPLRSCNWCALELCIRLAQFAQDRQELYAAL